MSNSPLLVGMAALLVLVTQSAAASPARKTPDQIRDLAEKYGLMFGLDPIMIRAIVEIESGRNPLAFRPELQIGDASVGLMQTLLRTAVDMYDKGYRAKPKPTLTNLIEPDVSMYYGCAYLAWLSHYSGIARSVDWVVQSYNAGPGHTSPAYLAKYRAARARLIGG